MIYLNWPKLGLQGELRDGTGAVWKDNGETESLEPPELAANRQKNTKNIITTYAADDFLLSVWMILIPRKSVF